MNYNFQHSTSSPLFPQSNGQVECALQTVKRLLTWYDDPYMVLLTYHSTPLPWCNYSPAELFMGRCLRTTLPIKLDQLKPPWPYFDKFQDLDKQFKQKQTQKHRCVGYVNLNTHIRQSHSTCECSLINTPQGEIRQNWLHLNVVPYGHSST